MYGFLLYFLGLELYFRQNNPILLEAVEKLPFQIFGSSKMLFLTVFSHETA